MTIFVGCNILPVIREELTKIVSFLNEKSATGEFNSAIPLSANKMKRSLYTSNYNGTTGYLMDFGFGGYVGYGGGVPSLLVMKELRRRMMYDG